MSMLADRPGAIAVSEALKELRSRFTPEANLVAEYVRQLADKDPTKIEAANIAAEQKAIHLATGAESMDEPTFRLFMRKWFAVRQVLASSNANEAAMQSLGA